MTKLNNKGMTIIEILLCFVLVTVISGSIYSTVNAFSNQKEEETAKQKIYTYKNLLTREIEDDIIKKGLIKVELIGDHQSIAKSYDDCKNAQVYYAWEDTCHPAGITPQYNDQDDNTFNPNNATRYYIKFSFRSSRDKILLVVTQNDREALGLSDKYFVAYGDPQAGDSEEGMTKYPIPDFGYYQIDREDGDPIRNLKLSISSVNTKQKDGLFYFEMKFEHDVLDQRYGIRIIAPINMDSYDKTYDNTLNP